MIIRIIAGLGAAGLLAVALTFWFACPCDRTPGGPLRGELITEPVADWSFANEVPLCQLQVQGPIPWSINLNCMAADGDLFVSCSGCEGKTWSTWALADPRGRIRLGERLYPVNMARVADPAELDRAWQARMAKLKREGERPGHWWSFRLTSRPG